MTRDPRVDDFIAQAPPFARPILDHLRARVHAVCPDAVETIKWGRPMFEHGKRVFASFGAFKAHCSFALWRLDAEALPKPTRDEGMGQFGKLTALSDLPDDAAIDLLIRAATDVIDAGPVKRPRKPPRPEADVPEALATALAVSPAARTTFDAFPPSHRHEYCEWIGEAKRPETQAKRVAQAIEWLSEGKSRNWQYQR